MPDDAPRLTAPMETCRDHALEVRDAFAALRQRSAPPPLLASGDPVPAEPVGRSTENRQEQAAKSPGQPAADLWQDVPRYQILRFLGDSATAQHLRGLLVDWLPSDAVDRARAAQQEASQHAENAAYTRGVEVGQEIAPGPCAHGHVFVYASAGPLNPPEGWPCRCGHTTFAARGEL